MRELRRAGLADLADHIATVYLLPSLHADAALLHVAVAALPSAAVLYQHTVAAALVLGQRLFDLFPSPVTVAYSIAQPQHRALRSSKHIDALLHRDSIAHGEIGAVMAVIGLLPATEVGEALRSRVCI